MHGGSTPKGQESPHFKHGRRSDYLPTRLAAHYEAIESDLEANVLSRNIRLREALIRERLSWLEDAPDAAQVWLELRTLIDDVHLAYSRMDDGKMTVTLERINRVIDERNLYHQSAAEIRKDLNEQRNDTNAKAAISLKGENAVSVSELMAFVGAIVNLISTTVSNANERNRIYDAIERLASTKESAPRELVESTSIHRGA